MRHPMPTIVSLHLALQVGADHAARAERAWQPLAWARRRPPLGAAAAAGHPDPAGAPVLQPAGAAAAGVWAWACLCALGVGGWVFVWVAWVCGSARWAVNSEQLTVTYARLPNKHNRHNWLAAKGSLTLDPAGIDTTILGMENPGTLGRVGMVSIRRMLVLVPAGSRVRLPLAASRLCHPSSVLCLFARRA